MLLSIVEGWTGLLGPFTLRIGGAAVDLTGMTVTLSMRRESGTLVTPGGTITVLDQTTNKGQVTYAPIASDFVFEPNRYNRIQTYTLRWKVVDGSAKVVYFPNADPEEIGVGRA